MNLMNFTLMLVVATGAAFPMGVRAEDSADVQEIKKTLSALTAAFEKRDADVIKRLTSEDHVSITTYYASPMHRADQIKTLPDLKFRERAVRNVKVTVLCTDAALVTSYADVRGSFQGKEMPAKVCVSHFMVKRDGRWLEALYQETPIDAK